MFRLSVIVWLFFAVCQVGVAAELEPRVCTALIPGESDGLTWGLVGGLHPHPLIANCPADSAYISLTPPGGPNIEGPHVVVRGTCCPLPPGILTTEHSFAESQCPKNHLATGLKQVVLKTNETFDKSLRREANFWQHSRKHLLRCSKINSRRFELERPVAGVIVTSDLTLRDFFQKRTSIARVPLGIRYAIGRRSRFRWAERACLGIPWGGVLVGKHSKYCEGFRFSRVLFKGIAGDPPAGTPVNIIPDCIALKGVLSKSPECVLGSEVLQ